MTTAEKLKELTTAVYITDPAIFERWPFLFVVIYN